MIILASTGRWYLASALPLSKRTIPLSSIFYIYYLPYFSYPEVVAIPRRHDYATRNPLVTRLSRGTLKCQSIAEDTRPDLEVVSRCSPTDFTVEHTHIHTRTLSPRESRRIERRTARTCRRVRILTDTHAHIHTRVRNAL